MSAYRNEKNEIITFEEWRELCQPADALVEEIENEDGYKIEVIKQYYGLIGNVFKVIVNCSSDLLDYYGYKKGFSGELEATNDYNRVIDAIKKGESIFDEILEHGNIQLIFDQMYNQHIVCDMREELEIDYCYKSNQRDLAVQKFNELKNG